MSPEENRHLVESRKSGTSSKTSARLWWPCGIGLAIVSVTLVLRLIIVSAVPRHSPAPTASHQPSPASAADGMKSVAETVELKSARVAAQDAAEQALLDPSEDGWPSEAFAERAKVRLNELFARVTAARPPRSARALNLDRFLSDDVRCTPLRPQRLRTGYRDSATRVLWPAEQDDNLVAATEYHGRGRCVAAFRSLMAPLAQVGPARVHIKIIRVDLQSTTASTTFLYEATSHNQSESVQQSATWHCEWEGCDTAAPRLCQIKVQEFEEVHAQGSSGKWFADCTGAVLGHELAFQHQLNYGLNHWLQRVERAHEMDDSVRNGLAVGDANGDGLDDVYLCQAPGLPNRLLLQNLDGTVRDVSARAGVDWLDHTTSALFVDLDNDGDQDLAIATIAGLLLMENDSQGQFHLRRKLLPDGIDVQSLTAADYDQDGDLDLFVCVYRPLSGRSTGDFVFHDATTGGPNYLLRNDLGGDPHDPWKMTDVTHDSGLHVGSTRYTLAAAWEDYDNDGDQDLYVANDYGRNYLYRNEGGHFVDVTQLAGLNDTGFGMSVSWGDYNRDGRMDLYIGNMFSSAGSRITRHPAFQRGASQWQRGMFQRMARGNSLFAGREDGTFQDVSAAAHVEMGRWAWSSVFADLNNDGWEDLVVANGYITTEDTGDL